MGIRLGELARASQDAESRNLEPDFMTIPVTVSNIHLEDAVLPGDVHALVGEEGDLHGAEAALLSRRVDPRQVAEVRVSRAGDQLATDLAEPEGGERKNQSGNSHNQEFIFK